MNFQTNETQNEQLYLLFRDALYNEMSSIDNPHVTYETIVLRILMRLAYVGGINTSSLQQYMSSRTNLFGSICHREILEQIQRNLSPEEMAIVERVLGKDAPHPSDLIKFATCWMKRDSLAVYRWFAVDGLLGNQPKLYVNEAFSPDYSKHCSAIRKIYVNGVDSPEKMKEIMLEAFRRIDTVEGQHADPEIERFVEMYLNMVEKEEAKRIRNERITKINKSGAAKRKREEEAGEPVCEVTTITL